VEGLGPRWRVRDAAYGRLRISISLDPGGSRALAREKVAGALCTTIPRTMTRNFLSTRWLREKFRIV